MIAVAMALALWWWLGRDESPETAIRAAWSDLTAWVEDGVGLQSVPLAMHARHLDRFFTEQSRVQVIPGGPVVVGLSDIRSMAVGGLGGMDSINLRSDWDRLEVDERGERADSQVRVRVQVDGRGRDHRGEGVFAIRWTKIDRQWKIDTVELISHS